MFPGFDPTFPVRMFRTNVVPAAVPFDCHNSTPLLPSSALKINVLPKATKFDGEEPRRPRWISLTKVVPAEVPSDFQSSYPPTPSSALKNNVPLTFVKLRTPAP